MPELVLENLTKRFGDLVAVNNLSLRVEHGEFAALLGPSGCGKTTTLRMIAGLLKPDSGRIYIGGEDVTDLPPQKRNVGLVFQSWAIFPDLTAYENLVFGLKVRKLPENEIKERAKRFIEMLSLESVLNIKGRHLDPYNKQKVALARTLITEPSIILLDEPLSNLDAPLRVAMRVKLKEIQRDLKATILYVTHDQVEAMSMAERVAVMNEGKLMQYDSPYNIYHKPANIFVAGFIGGVPINFIDCTYFSKDDKAYLDAGAFKLDITPLKSVVEGKLESEEVVLGIRPGDIIVTSKKKEEVSIEGTVENVEYVGDEIIIYLNVGGIVIRGIVPVTFDVDIGDKLWYTLPLDKIHIFNKKSENAIV